MLGSEKGSVHCRVSKQNKHSCHQRETAGEMERSGVHVPDDADDGHPRTELAKPEGE